MSTATAARPPMHDAWIVACATFVVLLITAGIRANTGVVYGWIGASHQMGAALAAFGAGAIRSALGDYRVALWIAGVLCVIAGGSFLTIGRRAFRAAPLATIPLAPAAP